MHARVHDDDAAQDIRNMGGLRKCMPLTHWTFAAATAAIIGLPLTSGFFSKDEILYRAYVDHTVNPLAGTSMLRGHGVYAPPEWIGPALYWAARRRRSDDRVLHVPPLLPDVLGRLPGLDRRPPVALGAARARGCAHGADASRRSDDEPHPHHEDLSTPGYPPHESPWQMTVPLIVLATFSVFAGFLNPGFVKVEKPMDHWLEPVFKAATEASRSTTRRAEHLEWHARARRHRRVPARDRARVVDVHREEGRAGRAGLGEVARSL